MTVPAPGASGRSLRGWAEAPSSRSLEPDPLGLVLVFPSRPYIYPGLWELVMGCHSACWPVCGVACQP